MERTRIARGALAVALAIAPVSAGCGGAAAPPRAEPAPSNSAAPPPEAGPQPAPEVGAEPGARTNAIDEHRKREVAEGSVPSISPQDLLERYERKQKTYVIEVRGGEGFPAIEGAEVVRPDVLDAWAGRHPKTAYIVAYCT